MSERDERLAVPGPQGQRGEQGSRGEQGEQGVAGLSRSVRRAVVFLCILNLLFAFANILWTAHAIQASNLERCSSIEAATQIPVPQPAAGNPSREFDARLEAIDRQRERQLGCKGG